MTLSRFQQIQEMLKSEPTDSFLNYALALEFAKENNFLQATELIEKVLQLDENYLAAYYQLGKYYEERNELEKAIATYQKGIEIAKKQNNRKTLAELNEALILINE